MFFHKKVRHERKMAMVHFQMNLPIEARKEFKTIEKSIILLILSREQ